MDRPPTLLAQLSQQVLDLIAVEGMVPGDRLPSVNELAKRYSVTPPTIREALRSLQAVGIVDIRHGAGTFVRATGHRLLLSNPHHTGLDAQTLVDLLDARVQIEPYLAGLAAERRTEKELEELGDVLATAEHQLASPDELHFWAGMEFHRKVALASRQTVLGQAVDSLLDLYSREQQLIHRFHVKLENDFQEHQSVLVAIRDQSVERATTAMRSHIEEVSSVVKVHLGDSAVVSPGIGR